jgi:hypothetical protein
MAIVFEECTTKEQHYLVRFYGQKDSIYAAGFDAPVKRWDKCINVGGGYVEK